MVITRKIQVYVYDDDTEEKKNFIHTLYGWRDNVRRAANAIVAHKFVQQNIRDFVYIKDDIAEKFYVKDIIKDGKGMSEQNTTYRLCSEMMKGKVPSDIFSCLNQAISHTFKETVKDMNMGKASVRSYKNNIPIPFSAKSLANIHWNADDKRFYFTLFGVPFACSLGRDRSNNQLIVERCISGEYKLCGSSIQIDDERKKMFLLLCCDIPKREVELIDGKKLYAFLGVMNPIVCTTEVNAKNEYDSGMKVYEIGTAEEFNYRRRQIQEAVKRCQINNRYSVGGKGRKRKCQAIDRYHDKENNYVDTKLHTYSRMLVDLAVKYKCSTIILMKQKEREEKAKDDNAKGDNFVLRNWTYFGLKTKIEYKAKMYGINIEVE
jgi:IS605 OrfB family transposase